MRSCSLLSTEEAIAIKDLLRDVSAAQTEALQRQSEINLTQLRSLGCIESQLDAVQLGVESLNIDINQVPDSCEPHTQLDSKISWQGQSK